MRRLVRSLGGQPSGPAWLQAPPQSADAGEGRGVSIISTPSPRLVAIRMRRRGLPEHTNYQDTGCEVSPSCLRCPLAICKYDAPRVFGMMTNTVVRRVRILQHRRLGRSMRQIAAIENLSLRTVRLACRDAKKLVA